MYPDYLLINPWYMTNLLPIHSSRPLVHSQEYSQYTSGIYQIYPHTTPNHPQYTFTFTFQCTLNMLPIYFNTTWIYSSTYPEHPQKNSQYTSSSFQFTLNSLPEHPSTPSIHYQYTPNTLWYVSRMPARTPPTHSQNTSTHSQNTLSIHSKHT